MYAFSTIPLTFLGINDLKHFQVFEYLHLIRFFLSFNKYTTYTNTEEKKDNFKYVFNFDNYNPNWKTRFR